MSNIDLLFESSPGTPNLVFGGSGGVPARVDILVAITLPAMTADLKAIPDTTSTFTAVMPAMTLDGIASYNSYASRPLVNKSSSEWQWAAPVEVGLTAGHDNAAPAAVQAGTSFERSVPVRSSASTKHDNAVPSSRPPVSSRYQKANHISPTGSKSGYEEANRSVRSSLASVFTTADKGNAEKKTAGHQDGLRTHRNTNVSPFQKAKGGTGLHHALAHDKGARSVMQHAGWYQKAIVPPAGTAPGIVVPPVKPPCYTPPNGLAVDLLFKDPAGTVELVFRCPNEEPYVPPAQGLIVVPVQRTYIVLNSVHLRRVDGNLELPCYSLSMQLDRDSWTWGFSASLHASAMPLIEPAAFGEPVELDAEVNGVHYRLLAEGISRDRQFGSARISLTGRGKSAILSDPYSPIRNFTNTQTRTAEQLINDVLTNNGVPIGWSVDFGLADWNVPEGLFAHNGSYMSAVKAIADSIGAYVQPDPLASKIYIKPAYPVLPWNLASATPDFELPVDVTSKEAISWFDRPAYNAVYVSGTSQGVLALVRRQGTAGDLLAPMVADNLITDDIAARQRGESILGSTGRIAEVTLEMPILPATGIIPPGKIVRYLDGGVSRMGITRSVSVNTELPKARQQIQVETHV